MVTKELRGVLMMVLAGLESIECGACDGTGDGGMAPCDACNGDGWRSQQWKAPEDAILYRGYYIVRTQSAYFQICATDGRVLKWMGNNTDLYAALLDIRAEIDRWIEQGELIDVWQAVYEVGQAPTA